MSQDVVYTYYSFTTVFGPQPYMRESAYSTLYLRVLPAISRQGARYLGQTVVAVIVHITTSLAVTLRPITYASIMTMAIIHAARHRLERHHIRDTEPLSIIFR